MYNYSHPLHHELVRSQVNARPDLIIIIHSLAPPVQTSKRGSGAIASASSASKHHQPRRSPRLHVLPFSTVRLSHECERRTAATILGLHLTLFSLTDTFPDYYILLKVFEASRPSYTARYLIHKVRPKATNSNPRVFPFQLARLGLGTWARDIY